MYILDYSTFVKEVYDYDIKGPSGRIAKKDVKLPEDYQLFFNERGVCPFCRIKTEKVFDHHSLMDIQGEDWDFDTIWECQNCGWWEYFHKWAYEKDCWPDAWGEYEETLRHAVLRRFDVASKDVPIKSLASEVGKNTTIMYKIHPRKLEEMTQYVFSSYYDCEVKHVGQSNDGGIDLIIVDSDYPILVQVKRRSNDNATESVSTVRDLLGAMYINSCYRGIVVSTAKKFSCQARKVVEDLYANGRIDSFQLVDFNSLCEMLNLANRSGKKYWESLVENIKDE